MNDRESAELMRREQRAREMGRTSNAYTCPVCLELTGREAAATYLDWPAYVDGEGHPYCGRHAPSGLDIVRQPHEKVAP